MEHLIDAASSFISEAKKKSRTKSLSHALCIIDPLLMMRPTGLALLAADSMARAGLYSLAEDFLKEHDTHNAPLDRIEHISGFVKILFSTLSLELLDELNNMDSQILTSGDYSCLANLIYCHEHSEIARTIRRTRGTLNVLRSHGPYRTYELYRLFLNGLVVRHLPQYCAGKIDVLSRYTADDFVLAKAPEVTLFVSTLNEMKILLRRPERAYLSGYKTLNEAFHPLIEGLTAIIETNDILVDWNRDTRFVSLIENSIDLSIQNNGACLSDGSWKCGYCTKTYSQTSI